MQIIDGKKISQEIKDEVKEEVAKLKSEGKDIALAVIQVGADPASSVYNTRIQIVYTITKMIMFTKLRKHMAIESTALIF